MEQLLNIVWLLAVGGLVWTVWARPHRTRHPRSPYAALVIFACIALLLFPVISASDDMHTACVLGDDGVWRHDKRSLGAPLLALFVLISLAPLVVRAAANPYGLTELAAAAAAGHLRLDAGRSPPVN